MPFKITLQCKVSFFFFLVKFKISILKVSVSYCSDSLEFDNAERPECNNLLTVYQIVSGKTKEVWRKI